MMNDLEMQPIRDNQAKKLSGGQRRKLSIGIAVLGSPKVRGHKHSTKLLLVLHICMHSVPVFTLLGDYN